MSPVNANSGEYKSRIGLDSLYIAEVTVDSASAYTADTPEYFAPAAQASQAPATNVETQYADDQPYDVISSKGPTSITIQVTNLPMEMLAKITGKVFDAVSGRMFDHGGEAPYIALSFRSLKSNGSYRYYQYLKGRFTMPNEETETKGETPAPKTLELTYTAITTVYEFDLGSVDDSVSRVVGDEDTDNFDGSTWFDQVQTPVAAAPSALSLSSSDPVDGATNVVVSVNLTLTFNNALIANAIYGIVLTKDDGTLKAAGVTLDATKKIITVDPTTNMAGSTDYLLTYGVIDIYGQTLSGVINFTTA